MVTRAKPANASAEMWAKTVAFMDKQDVKRAKTSAASQEATAKAIRSENLRKERVQFNEYIKTEGSRRRQALINGDAFVPKDPPAPISPQTAAEQALLLAKRAQDFLKYEKYQTAAQKHYERVIAARPELASKY